MQRHWKRYLLLAALAVVLAYIGWRMYEDYELSTYPQRVASTIPVPPGARLIKQREGANKQCRSAGIIQYYATNLPWDQVMAFYRDSIETSLWKPRVPDIAYVWDQIPDNQKLNLNFRWIRITDNDVEDIELQAMNSGEIVYLVQVGYTQDMQASVAYCTPDD